MGDLRDHLRIAWLREVEWGVTSFLDFLLRIFRALQAEYPDAVLAARVEALYSLPADEAEQAGAALLKVPMATVRCSSCRELMVCSTG